MREGKGFAANAAGKWMVVLVELFVALCRHTGVPHNDVYTARHAQAQLAGWQRALEDAQPSAEVIGDAGRIRAAHLAFAGERVQDAVLFAAWSACFDGRSVRIHCTSAGLLILWV